MSTVDVHVESTWSKYASIPRLRRNWIATEKIDGSNGQILIWRLDPEPGRRYVLPPHLVRIDDLVISAGSRNRWVHPDDDNFGFGAWVHENAPLLASLGPGRHFGEWYGQGIQRGYGLDHRRFALFDEPLHGTLPAHLPEVQVVPRLAEGSSPTIALGLAVDALAARGSEAAPGYANPEGVVVTHEDSGHRFKWTFDGDGHKGAGK